MKRKMHLLAYMKTGPTAMHAGGWRHPESTLTDLFDPVRYERDAQLFEAARLDGAFFADLFGIHDVYKGGLEMFVGAGGQTSYLDPVTVLPVMGRVTSHLGLTVTISSSFQTPFQIARVLASVDLLSKGRAGWNVVTSHHDLEARNAGMDGVLPHDERYDRADEVMEACMALWRSWDADALVLDKRSGQFADPEKVHYANYEGKWIRTRGPLPSPRSPQGHPVIIQAGSSERGREFAARWAEVIFAPWRETKAFYDDVHNKLAAAGREPSSCKIVPSITPIVGETESIAQERADYLDSLEHPEYSAAWASTFMGADLSKHKTIEEVRKARGDQGSHGGTELMSGVAEKAGVTLAQSEGRRQSDATVVGTPEMIADYMEELFVSEACDGFIVEPTSFPTSHEQFCRAVVPELQRRGLFRTEYSSGTLRGNLQDG